MKEKTLIKILGVCLFISIMCNVVGAFILIDQHKKNQQLEKEDMDIEYQIIFAQKGDYR